MTALGQRPLDHGLGLFTGVLPVRLPLRSGDGVRIFLAPVARDDRGLDVPGGERLRGFDQPLAELGLVFGAMPAKQRILVGKHLLGRDAQRRRQLQDVGLVLTVTNQQRERLVPQHREQREPGSQLPEPPEG